MTAEAPALPRVAGDRPLRFQPLTFTDDGEDVVVGRTDVDTYVVLPGDGAALLRWLYDGAGVGEAAGRYAREFGEPVDVEDFLDSLAELGLLRDSAEAPDTADGLPSAGPGERSPVRWQRLGAAVFSGPAWAAYLLVVLAGVAAVIADPGLAPRREHVFFSDSFLVVELTLFALQLPLVLVHELAHVLAGRRLGLRTRLRVSRRFYFLVFETVMNGLVTVPRRRRYLPMLAGMLADLVLAAGFTAAAWALRGPVADVAWAAGLCLALALTTLLRIAWQMYFFLRTDVYYLLSTVLGCVDLHTTSRQYLWNAVNRCLGRHDRLVPEDAWHPRDRRAARWYAPLVVVGYALALTLLVLVLLPITWTFLAGAVGRVFLGEASSSGQFWDSALLLTLNGSQLALAVVIAVRERRASRRPAAAPASSPPPTSRRSWSEHDVVPAAPVARRSRGSVLRPAGKHVRPRAGAQHRKRRP